MNILVFVWISILCLCVAIICAIIVAYRQKIAQKTYAKKRLAEITPVLQKIALGDFSSELEVTDEEDEFTELFVTLNLMAEDLREMVGTNAQLVKELKKESSLLEKRVARRTEALAKSLATVEAEKRKTDAILHSINDAVFVVDIHYRIIAFNPMAEQLSGYSQSEVLGKVYNTILQFHYDKNNAPHDMLTQEFSDSDTEATKTIYHTKLLTKTNESIPITHSAAPMEDKNGNIIGCVVVFRNATKERDIDRTKTEFVSLASHQLRTPLTSINWYAEMLLDGSLGKLNAKQKTYITKIHQGNKRMVDLVDALLNISRLELGTFTVEVAPTNIVEIAESVISECEPHIVAKKIALTTTFDTAPLTISTDKKLMAVVIQNILSNAIKYTPEKGKIHFSIEHYSAGNTVLGHHIPKNGIGISISDTGYGIPKNQYNKLFTKLFRADNIKEKDATGTGLGLYLVKSILDATDGSIWFQSRLNKGTTFFVYLPL